MKKGTTYFLIFNLVLSIIAISFLVNLDVVGGEEENYLDGTVPGDSSYEEGDEILKNIFEDDWFGDDFFYGSSSGTPNPVESLKVKTGTTAGDWLLNKGWVGIQNANFMGHLAQGLAWSTGVIATINMFGSFFLEDSQVDALSSATFGGIMAGEATYGLLKSGGWFGKSSFAKWAGSKFPGGVAGLSTGAGIVVGALIFAATYKETTTETITFTCETWEAPIGGNYCEECNKGNLPCSEYQCRSLGQACELLNAGTNEQECVWVNRNDVEFPTIQPWEDALLEDYKYTPDNSISPPDSGVKVQYKDSTTGCVKAFTPLSFGILTNEPSKCKIDYTRKETYKNMDYFFGGNSLFRYNHTQVMSLPGPSNVASENLTLQNGGDYELYARCADANGNYNTANYVFKFCVDDGPDTTAPLIVSTSTLNNSPIAYNKKELNLNVYVNEPAECRWDHIDRDYEEMNEQMNCASSITEMNAQMLYECSTTLTGINNDYENTFYFRCKDQPNADESYRNTNTESYEFTLFGTIPLVIDEVGPNGTVKDSTDSVQVTLTAETSAGYNEGESICYYSPTGDDGSYVKFLDTGSYTHSQDLWLLEGNYEYFIKCIDAGGNSYVMSTEFDVESDSDAPLVARAYHDSNYLKLITNEEAECVYDTVDCSYLFGDGITIQNEENGEEHYIDWNTQTNFYVKCQDGYGNSPLPNECSIIIRPFEIDY